MADEGLVYPLDFRQLMSAQDRIDKRDQLGGRAMIIEFGSLPAE
jgi:hypothetical protein